MPVSVSNHIQAMHMSDRENTYADSDLISGAVLKSVSVTSKTFPHF